MSRFIVRGQLPQLGVHTLAGSTFDVRPTRPGAQWEYFYAILDEPVSYRVKSGGQLLVDDIVFRSANPNEMPHFGMRGFRVQLGLVLDPSLRDDPVLDLRGVEFIGLAELDDADPASSDLIHPTTADGPGPDPLRAAGTSGDDMSPRTGDDAPGADRDGDGAGEPAPDTHLGVAENPTAERDEPAAKPATTSGDDMSPPPEQRLPAAGRDPYMLFTPTTTNAPGRGAEPAEVLDIAQTTAEASELTPDEDSGDAHKQESTSVHHPTRSAPTSDDDRSPGEIGDDLVGGDGAPPPLGRAARALKGLGGPRDRSSQPASRDNRTLTSGDDRSLWIDDDEAYDRPLRSEPRSPEEMTAIIPAIAPRSADEFTAIFEPKPRDVEEMTSIIPPLSAMNSATSIPPASLPRAGWEALARKAEGPSCRRIAIIGGSAGALLIVIAAMVWLLNDSPDSPQPAPAPTTSSSLAAAPSTTTRLTPPPPVTAGPEAVLPLLPPGYPQGACVADDHPPAGALASVACNANTEPGGPAAAQYSLFPEGPPLKAAFDSVVGTAAPLVCPGGIQSPGPWRRNANLDAVVGTVYCGTNTDKSPVIIWTDDARRLLSVIHPGPDGPDLPTMFGWWSTHS